MPISQLIVELLIFFVVEDFAQTQVATADGLSNIANTTLLDKLRSNVLIGMAQLLELDDAAIIRIVVRSDWLGCWSNTTGNAQFRSLVFAGGELLGLRVVVLFEQVRGLCSGKADDDAVESGKLTSGSCSETSDW